MRNQKGVAMRMLVLIGLLALVAPAFAQGVEFIPLGKTCGPAFFPTFCVVDMSGDGETVLFRDALWTEAGGMVPIEGPPGGFQVSALSDDGSTVVGNIRLMDPPLGPRNEAAIWLGGDQWQPLGGLPGATPCGTSYTSAFDVSADGSKVVGLAWIGVSCKDSAHGFEWTEATGMVDLGAIVDGRASRANVISADGAVIAGWSDSSFGTRYGAMMDGDGWQWFEGGPESPNLVGEATGINSDGSVIVGGNYADGSNPLSLFEAWMWTADTGVVSLGTAKGLRGDIVDGQHYSRDVSDDGGVVVGQTTLFNLGEQWATIWLEGTGMDMLQNYVRENTDPASAAVICDAERGPLQPCTDWDFWNTAAVSNDGKTIVGTGRNPDGMWEAFMIKRP